MRLSYFAIVIAAAFAAAAQAASDPDTGVAFYDLHNTRRVIAEKPATHYAVMACDTYVLGKVEGRKSSTPAVKAQAKQHHTDLLQIEKPAAQKAFRARYGKMGPLGSVEQLDKNITKMQANVIQDMQQKGYSFEDLTKFIDTCYFHATMLGKFYKE